MYRYNIFHILYLIQPTKKPPSIPLPFSESLLPLSLNALSSSSSSSSSSTAPLSFGYTSYFSSSSPTSSFFSISFSTSTFNHRLHSFISSIFFFLLAEEKKELKRIREFSLFVFSYSLFLFPFLQTILLLVCFFP